MASPKGPVLVVLDEDGEIFDVVSGATRNQLRALFKKHRVAWDIVVIDEIIDLKTFEETLEQELADDDDEEEEDDPEGEEEEDPSP